MNLIDITMDFNARNTLRASKEDKTVFYTYNINGISSHNEYVPISATQFNLGIYNGQIVHYTIPKIPEESIIQTSYPALYRNMKRRSMPFVFKTKSMEKRLLGAKGILFEEMPNDRVSILFLVAVKTSYMKRMHSATELDKSQFALFVSKEFYTSLKYKALMSKFQREVLKPHIENGIKVIITNNIEEECFKNNVEVPKFKAVTEMKKYLSSFNQTI